MILIVFKLLLLDDFKILFFLFLNKFLETGFDQVILPEWFEISMSSLVLGAYISFIALFLLLKVELQ